MKIRLLYIILPMVFPLLALGQSPAMTETATEKLSLRDVISIATDSSLSAFRARHTYLGSYWEFRTYKAQNLPQLSIASTPIKYNQNFVLRYNSETNIEEYRPQQTISSAIGLSVKQNVGPLGGTFYIDTDLDFVKNFSSVNEDYQQFSTTPIRIGYNQPLFGYNQFRWEKKIEPIKYEAAKRNLLFDMESISENVTELFFALVMAQTNYKTAENDLANADTLYAVGQQRYSIAAISKSDLLTLNLDVINARNTLETRA